MRLSCPNCGAQYEVPDDIIPQAGRDVQCSSCGHTWFQPPPESDTDLAIEVGGSVPDEGWSQTESQHQPISQPGSIDSVLQSEPEEEIQPPQMDFADKDDDEEDSDISSGDDGWVDDTPDPLTETHREDTLEDASWDSSEPGLQDDEEEEVQASIENDQNIDLLDEDMDDDIPERQVSEEIERRARKAIDPEIADILREEAEHEARVRTEEASVGLETQPDLGLIEPSNAPKTEATRRAIEARARMQRMRGLSNTSPAPEDVPVEQTLVEPHESRRDLLPDIEEINSTLRSTDDREAGQRDKPSNYGTHQRRSGFRLGFSLMLLFAAAALLVYVYNRQIIASVPEAEPYILSYLENIDSARVWLDSRVTEMMLWLEGFAGSSGDTPE